MRDTHEKITNGSFWKNEIIAGFTTFFTMAYIIVVNPILLSKAGMDYGAVFVATCLSAAFGCFIMGLLSNYPIALAPSMTLNAYFTFYVIQQLHYSWQAALGIVFLSGLLFAILSLTQLRQWLIYSMPHSLKLAIAGGIGLFLVVIALKSLGIDFKNGWSSLFNINLKIWFCVLGVLLAVIFERFRIIGSILLSMVIITLIGKVFGLVQLNGYFEIPPSIAPTFLQLTLPSLVDLQTYIVILIFLFVALFDNTGTLVAVLHEANLLPGSRADAKAVKLGKALFADSVASMSGALLGTSSTGSYIESAAGVRAGGKSGITAIIVGILFLCALFVAPLAKAIPDYASAAALIYVGILMSRNIMALDWRDFSEIIPALICVIVIPASFSIADGVAAGFISHVLLKALTKKRNEIKLGLLLITGLCVLYLMMKI